MEGYQGIVVSAIPTAWLVFFFLIFIGAIYWNYDKRIGFQLLYLTLLSISLAHVIILYFPYLYTVDALLPVIHPQVQVTMTFFAFFIPLTRNRLQIFFCLVPPVAMSLSLVVFWGTPVFSIVGSIFLGGFIIYTFYRTLDWIGSMPEPYLITFSIIIPVFLAALIYPSETYLIYPGILLGTGIGAAWEAFKVRMSVPEEHSYKKVIALLVGGTGLMLFYGLDQLIYPWIPIPHMASGLFLGLWISFIVPLLLTGLKLYQKEGRSRVFV
ncbi:hypothetical protein [Evansella tamaricis]|uniref:Uncharacterized protein n=1 Tax=Evansella tamaricis TaxID=2069301 RepID=A0ABS6JID5_9BACI|nr:hypothetical protein [Evansella tamaricis]MBU9712220.1 hypothetical protein [Evansella tamaricis]